MILDHDPQQRQLSLELQPGGVEDGKNGPIRSRENPIVPCCFVIIISMALGDNAIAS